jgi:hypothetical protein
MPVNIGEVEAQVDDGGGSGGKTKAAGKIDDKLVEQVAARVLAMLREELRITAERRGMRIGR